MLAKINFQREIGKRDPMIYGHFLEHFHRQIYGGLYDPSSRFADEQGLKPEFESMPREYIHTLTSPELLSY